jgi:hypothetical protein
MQEQFKALSTPRRLRILTSLAANRRRGEFGANNVMDYVESALIAATRPA